MSPDAYGSLLVSSHPSSRASPTTITSSNVSASSIGVHQPGLILRGHGSVQVPGADGGNYVQWGWGSPSHLYAFPARTVKARGYRSGNFVPAFVSAFAKTLRLLTNGACQRSNDSLERR
jgi:hypothetical protein